MAGAERQSPVPVIETERLRLRAHRAEDHAERLAIWSDPTVTRFIGGRPQTSEEVWRRFLQYMGLWTVLGYGYWAVEEKSTGRYIGDIGFADFRRDLQPSLDGMLEFGWVLASHAHGKGYASEAVAAAIAWAELHRPDLRAVCIIDPANQPSIRVAEKAGFKRWQESTYHGGPTVVFSR
ncbi:GNAT family N-acetyltransferase [Dyella amyloliquefaciens]|uniref:GNAT family N-acetyltransferase n=1 Tax=Dyella amyloliquefaciens TaxID=1770545 RepID=UPI00102E2C6A|nr:GNAT family N-acetyltransferase [Dyella amyloliquefaciens]